MNLPKQRTAERQPELSVVVPMCNEEKGLEALFGRLLAVLRKENLTFEVVCVDDGSRDDTLDKLRDYAARVPEIRGVSLSRNFGKEVAVMAGLARARGDAVVVMDADLQHPPEAIPALVAEWRKGFKIVMARRDGLHHDSLMHRLSSTAFHGIFNAMSEVRLDPSVGEFLLLDRQVVRAVLSLPERHRFNRALIAWIGFKRAEVPVKIETRYAGVTQFGFRRLLRHSVNAIVSFGTFPLRVWSLIGLLVSFAALSYGAYIVIETVLYGADVPGYPTLIVTMLASVGIQLIGLGVIGEYLGKVYAEVKRRPLYVVGEEIGLGADVPPENMKVLGDDFGIDADERRRN